MTVKQVLSRAREALAASEIEDPSLETELLLRHTLGISRVQFYMELEHELSPEQEERFWKLVKRRLEHEPSAYLTGHREFYGLDFMVDHTVLIPRPETELLVEKALQLAQNHAFNTVADIGTGCGVIAISLALNLPRIKIYATDISASALEVARANCQKHGVANRVHLLPGDMLDPLSEPVDLIVANPPYVKQSEVSQLNTFNFEPALALDGGTDGLEKIRRLCARVKCKLNPGGCLLLEIGQGQTRAVLDLLQSLFPSAEMTVTSDLGGIERVVSLNLAGAKSYNTPLSATSS